MRTPSVGSPTSKSSIARRVLRSRPTTTTANTGSPGRPAAATRWRSATGSARGRWAGPRGAGGTRRTRPGQRLLAVTAVDGVNVISGDTAGWQQTGYVFGPYQGYEISGWRKSDREVAAFQFTAPPTPSPHTP